MAQRQTIVAIVEDDPSMLRATRDLLEAQVFAIVQSAEDFLNSRCASALDCLLLDIDLGAMTGTELRRQLNISNPALPIILMTALDDSAVERQAISAGCVAFLRKPFPQGVLTDAIKKSVAW